MPARASQCRVRCSIFFSYSFLLFLPLLRVHVFPFRVFATDRWTSRPPDTATAAGSSRVPLFICFFFQRTVILSSSATTDDCVSLDSC